MKILFVTQAIPRSNGAGWERRAAQHLRALTKLGSVTVVLPWGGAAVSKAERRAGELACIELGASSVMHREMPSLNDLTASAHLNAPNRFVSMVRALRRVPHFDARAQDAEKTTFRPIFLNQFDFALCFRIESAIWLDSILTASERLLGLVDFDDIESSIFEQTVLSKNKYSRFWTYKLRQSHKALKWAENRLAKEWSAVSVCSEVDAKRLAQIHNINPWVIPNGFEFDYCFPEVTSSTIKILFVGSFTHVPNANGILWFIKDVWPKVRSSTLSNIEITIVGFKPQAEILAFDNIDGIKVIANAPDVAPYYKTANIVIAPLLQGSGTRVKLLEAAARCRVIVSTSIGCEGLRFADGEHLAIADDAEEFSARILTLANDPDQRARLAQSAYAHAKALFEVGGVEDGLVLQIRACVERWRVANAAEP